MSQQHGDQASIEAIRQNRWRQGSIFTGAAIQNISAHQPIPQLDQDRSHWAVLSHDCDVIHHDFSNEADVEVIALAMTQTCDGNLLYGKNPRRLQIEDHQNGQWFEFHINSRRFIPRRSLAQFRPENGIDLSPDQVRDLASWIARRYVRTAFPDTFNNRIRPITSDLTKLLKSSGKWISGIYAAMEMVELPEDKPYDLILTITMRDEDFVELDRKEAIQQACNVIEALVNKNRRGIDIKKVLTLPESRLSLADWRKLHRLEFDYLSAANPSSPSTPRV